jgi:hypothetical protein
MNTNLEKALDILDKFDFFNQPAGYEHWIGMPKGVQDKDIEDKANDIQFLKDFICNQQSVIADYRKHLNKDFVVVGSRGSGKSELERQMVEFRVNAIRHQVITEYLDKLEDKLHEQELHGVYEPFVTVSLAYKVAQEVLGETE